MSFPPNPLSQFRSYSYYHVLAICDSSQTADDLAVEPNPLKWLHPTAPLSNDPNDTFGELGPFAIKYVDEKARTGRYCILINGSTDAAFTIVRAKWTSATAAEATMLDASTSIAIEGELEISEPKGVVFLDIIVNTCLALGIDAANAVFVLKTFFIGYPDFDNALRGDYSINDIEPLRFITYDISGSFAETGGLYIMSFVALAHGASRLPQYGKAASGFSFTGGTLRETFANLFNRVVQNYDALFNCVQNTVKDPKINELLTRVTYEFKLDPEYDRPEYVVTDQQAQAKDTVNCSDPAKIKISPNMSIEDAIHLIMRQCPKVTEEMSTGVTDKDGRTVRVEYKIHTAVDSAREPGPEGRVSYKVRYEVRRFMRPKDISLFEIAGGLDGDTLPENRLSELQERLRHNTIAFDYIYTGKNIDILEFDMKVNLGLAYLQIATINNTLKDQLQAVASAVTHVPLYDQQQPVRFGKPTQIPVFFGTQIKSPSTRNKQDISSNAEAAYSLQKHASIEVQDVTMRIYGNPRLLNTINRASGPRNLGIEQSVQNVEQREADFRSWGLFPAFARVNVKVPRNNDDISLFRGETGEDFTKDFWFNGFYYVVGIEHEFNAGDFTQVLSMVGIPQSKAFKAINRQGQNEQELEIQKQVDTCYDTEVNPCNQTPNQQTQTSDTGMPVLPQPPPPGPEEVAPLTKSAPPTNAADANVVLKSLDPSKVRGWSSASPIVRQAILTAASKHDVDSGFLAVVAAQESDFDPTKKNPLSTATGLYQFLDSTWQGTRPGTGMIPVFGKQLGLDNRTVEFQNAARNNPFIAAEAAALLAKENERLMRRTLGRDYQATTADLYLAHFAGPTVAAKIIREDGGGRGNAHPRTIFTGRDGHVSYETFITQNPTYARYTTITQVREANRQSIARRVVGGMPVLQSSKAVTPSPQLAASGAQGIQLTSVSSDVQPTSEPAAQTLSNAKACITSEEQQSKESSSCNQTRTESNPTTVESNPTTVVGGI